MYKKRERKIQQSVIEEMKSKFKARLQESRMSWSVLWRTSVELKMESLLHKQAVKVDGTMGTETQYS